MSVYPMPYSLQECPNAPFIIQLLNNTYVVYPGFKTYNGYQALGCNYSIIAGVLHYGGLSINVPQAYYVHPNGSLILAYTANGLQVISLSGSVFYNLAIGMVVRAVVFRLGAYYYIIASNTTSWLMVYRVVYIVR